MADAKLFLRQTAQTTAFAFREYFRPLVIVASFLKSRLAPGQAARPVAQAKGSVESTSFDGRGPASDGKAAQA
jgi:hypothetical protein